MATNVRPATDAPAATIPTKRSRHAAALFGSTSQNATPRAYLISNMWAVASRVQISRLERKRRDLRLGWASTHDKGRATSRALPPLSYVKKDPFCSWPIRANSATPGSELNSNPGSLADH